MLITASNKSIVKYSLIFLIVSLLLGVYAPVRSASNTSWLGTDGTDVTDYDSINRSDKLNLNLATDQIHLSVAPSEIMIAGLFPLTGTLAGGGVEREAAFRIAIEEINKNTILLPNTNITYIIKDTATDPTTGVQAATEAISAGAVAIVGAASSTVSKAIASGPAKTSKIPQISYSSTNPVLSDKTTYPYFLRVVAPDHVQGVVLAYIVEEFGWYNVSTLATTDDYGLGSITVFENTATSLGINIDTSQRFAQGQADITSQLQAIKDSGSKIIILNTIVGDTKTVFFQAANLGMTANEGYVWIGTDGAAQGAVFDGSLIIKEAMQGMIGTYPHRGSGPIYESFLDTWENCNGKTSAEYAGCGDRNPNLYAIFAYDAVYTYAHAFQRMLDSGDDVTNGDLLLAELYNTNIPGATGQISFDLNGDREGVYDIVNLQNDFFTKVGTWDKLNKMQLTSQIYWDGDPSGTNIDTPYVSKYIEHIPIIINGNGGFSALGFNGAGTIENPYRIEGLNISAAETTLISISNTDAHFSVENNILNGLSSISEGDGIHLIDVKNGVIENNEIYGSAGSGILVWVNNNTKIVMNKIHDNKGAGIGIGSASNNNLIANNSIYNNNQMGIVIEQTSDNNIIVDNYIHDNNGNGIDIVNSNGNTIENNDILDSSTGIFLENSTLNNIFMNKITRSTNGGIALQLSSDLNTVSNNTSFANGLSGIYIDNSTDNYILGNTANSNGHSGIFLYLTSQNTIVDNIIFGNSVSGIGLENSTENDVTENQVFDNNVGISLSFANRNMISDNTVYDHINQGINLGQSDSNTIVNNQIYKSDDHGLALDSSDHNIITGNEVYTNQFNGILIGSNDPSTDSNNTISFNNVHDNGESGIETRFLSNYNLITHNTAYKNNLNGISLKPGSYIHVTNNLVYDNMAGGIMISGVEWGGHGVSSNNLIANNKVLKEVFAIETWGIIVLGAQNTSIINNTLYNFEFAIEISNSLNIIISKNTIYDNINAIIMSDDNSINNVISANKLENNEAGIALAAQKTIIIDNIFIKNQFGIFIASPGNNVTGNTFYQNNIALEIDFDQTGNTIKYNDFIQNNIGSPQVVDRGDENTFAENFWDEWTTPDKNNDGFVDDPYEIRLAITGQAANSDDTPVAEPYHPDRLEFTIRGRTITTTSTTSTTPTATTSATPTATTSTTPTATTSTTDDTSGQDTSDDLTDTPEAFLPFAEVHLIILTLGLISITTIIRNKKD